MSGVPALPRREPLAARTDATYRHASGFMPMDFRSDDTALGLLGWILIIFILLVLFGFIGVRVWA